MVTGPEQRPVPLQRGFVWVFARDLARWTSKYSAQKIAYLDIRERQGKKTLPSIDSLPKCVWQLGLSHTEARNWDLNPGLPLGGRDHLEPITHYIPGSVPAGSWGSGSEPRLERRHSCVGHRPPRQRLMHTDYCDRCGMNRVREGMA